MVKTIGVAELKAQLSEILRQLERAEGRVVIERRGRPVAVLASYTPGLVAEETVPWAKALDGVARDVADFDAVMDEVIASRRDAGSRDIDLEDGTCSSSTPTS